MNLPVVGNAKRACSTYDVTEIAGIFWYMAGNHNNQGRVAKDSLRLRELVTIISKQ